MWSVQHDIKGLEKLVGKKRFAEKLDSFFTYTPTANAELPLFSTGMIGQYAHGNEPSHHAAYIFNKIGQPHKTQKYVRQILTELYNDTPAGLCGNEDCGQMSAWYVFSALGFYPLNLLVASTRLVHRSSATQQSTWRMVIRLRLRQKAIRGEVSCKGSTAQW